MVNHYAFAALKEKRAEITGKIREHEKAVARLKIELGHLDATMKLFDPNYPIENHLSCCGHARPWRVL